MYKRQQVPSGSPDVIVLLRPGSSVGMSVRLKSGRSPVRSRPWPLLQKQLFSYGPVAQLVSASPCHGEGRGFKSRQGRRSKSKPPHRNMWGFVVCSLRSLSVSSSRYVSLAVSLVSSASPMPLRCASRAVVRVCAARASYRVCVLFNVYGAC